MERSTGLSIKRYFSKSLVDVYNQFDWKKQELFIGKNKKITIDIPSSWSDDEMMNILDKFFNKEFEFSESSLKILIDRVANTIANQGNQEGYFESDEEAEIFSQELKFILLERLATFEPQVLIKTGEEESDRLLVSRITSNDNALQSIEELKKTINSEDDNKIVSVKLDGDSINIIKALVNNSSKNIDFDNKFISRNGSKIKEKQIFDFNKNIFINFKDNTDRWHSTPRVNSPLSNDNFLEYVHNDQSAIILASLNLAKFINSNNKFDIEAFKNTIKIVLIAQEILIGYTDYPNEKIAKNTRAYRQLGIGYSNLGLFLLSQGVSYESEEGQMLTMGITALLTGYAYTISSQIAKRVGPFAGFHKDRESVLEVIKMHYAALKDINASSLPEELLNNVYSSWDDALELSELFGVRNAHISLITSDETMDEILGSISNGAEPIEKSMLIRHANNQKVIRVLRAALFNLGYKLDKINEVIKYFIQNQSLDNCPDIKKEHLDILLPENNIDFNKSTSYLKMISSIQPFISGSYLARIPIVENRDTQSNLRILIEAWRLGIKSIKFIKDNKYEIQINKLNEKEKSEIFLDSNQNKNSERKKLSKVRKSKTISFQLESLRGYLIICEFENGNPGEIILKLIDSEPSLERALEFIVGLINVGLINGVDIKDYLNILTKTYSKNNNDNNKDEYREIKLIIDYIFQCLALNYLNSEEKIQFGTKLYKSKSDNEILNKVSDSNILLCYNCGQPMKVSDDCFICLGCGAVVGYSK